MTIVHCSMLEGSRKGNSVGYDLKSWTRSSDSDRDSEGDTIVHASTLRVVVSTKVDAFNKLISEGSVLDQRMFLSSKYLVTQEPNGMATIFYKPAKAGFMRSLPVDKSPCSSGFAHRVFFLHVKSTVVYGQNG